MDAFAKSDDERDFYFNVDEGFLVFVDLDTGQEELDKLEAALVDGGDSYKLLPKYTDYENRKFMEGFVNEKVYDIDTKEKLLDIIGGKEAKDSFLEFLYDNHLELDKWHQYYQERSRIRIIEYLRSYEVRFAFEEDLDLPASMIEKLKKHLFDDKVSREIIAARKTLVSKAATYYSSEALNPRPKRGRPPKQVAKVESEPTFSQDLYLNVPLAISPFLYTPDITAIGEVGFSARYDTEAELLASFKTPKERASSELDELNRKLASLRSLSAGVAERQAPPRGKRIRLPRLRRSKG